jgi:hypothetical protein
MITLAHTVYLGEIAAEEGKKAILIFSCSAVVQATFLVII